MTESCMAVCSTELWNMRLLITNISQGSEAMHVTCGGTFYYCCARNLLL